MRAKLIGTALGEEAPDLVLKNAKVVNVFTGETLPGDVAIREGRIAGVGSYQGPGPDLEGRYLLPGLINAHCHIESSMVTPPVYCGEELRWGVTTLIADPHELVNVAGAVGMDYMLEQTQGLPVDVFFQLPSCVPATPWEHGGAVFTPEEMAPFLEHPRVLGLGEMMNYPGVLGREKEVLEKLNLAEGRVVDGHAPELSGRELAAYLAAGILTDHESVSGEEALEKLRAGMCVLLRQGSAAKNLEDILPFLLKEQIDTTRLALCTDDKHLADIRREGTIRHSLRLAVSMGMKPESAVQLATINAARIYGLGDRGAIGPGYLADLVVVEDWKDFVVHSVYKNGICRFGPGVAEYSARRQEPSSLLQSVCPAALPANAFALPSRERYPVIRLEEGQIATRLEWREEGQMAEELDTGELCKIAVIERHHATGHMGLGLLAGYGLTEGAVATTVAHDSHNIIVAGQREDDMRLAVEELVHIQGGYVIVAGGKVADRLPLPVGGLMSPLESEELIADLERMLERARRLGISPGIDPFITLSFMALPVAPQVRITDMGIWDVEHRQWIG